MSIKKILKKILPVSVVAKLKMGREYFFYSQLIKSIENEENDADYMIGTPIHTNLGDHLITLAQKEFLVSRGYSKRIIEIPTEMFQAYKKRLIKVVPNTSVIFINGGGWMGNLWPDDERLLQEIVASFHNNLIFIFPQTIYYDKEKQPCEELILSGNEIFSKCNNLTLCVRDRHSYECAKCFYPTTHILFLPDIALAYYDKSPKNSGKNLNIVGYCLRKDREIFREHEVEKKIRQIFQKLGFKEKRITTTTFFRTPSSKREKSVMAKLDSFSKCSIIVTDRLHGMIFSFLTGTPCIILDNKTMKISGVYNEWLKKYDYILPCFSDLDECKVRNFIKKNCGVAHLENKVLGEEFGIMMEEIENG